MNSNESGSRELPICSTQENGNKSKLLEHVEDSNDDEALQSFEFNDVAEKIAALADAETPPRGWESAVRESIAANKKIRRWKKFGIGLGLAMPAFATILLALWPTVEQPRSFTIEIQKDRGQTRGGQLVLEGSLEHNFVEFRLYRNGFLFLSCSDTPPCVRSRYAIRAEMRLAPGDYRIVFARSDKSLPGDLSGHLENDLLELEASGAIITVENRLAVW